MSKRTEADVLALLRARHGEKSGNGEAFAFVTHVRSAAGFDAKRTIDAVAMGYGRRAGSFSTGLRLNARRAWRNDGESRRGCAE